MDTTTVIFLMLVNWIVTTILVESTLFAPWRDYVVKRAQRVLWDGKLHRMPFIFPKVTTPEQAAEAEIVMRGFWFKLAQLVTCHMCTGTWVGFAEAAVLGGPFHGWYAVIVNGLLFKAGGHLILELRAFVKLFDAPAAVQPGPEITADVAEDHQQERVGSE